LIVEELKLRIDVFFDVIEQNTWGLLVIDLILLLSILDPVIDILQIAFDILGTIHLDTILIAVTFKLPKITT
jgi:hypothetical protein